MISDTLCTDKLNTVKMHPFLTEEEQKEIFIKLIELL